MCDNLLAVICQKCSSVVPDGQRFCGNCGSKTVVDPTASLVERLNSVEAQLAKVARTEQEYLEVTTIESIKERVTSWVKRCSYWIGIPVGAILVLLALIVGKGEIDLRKSVSNAKTEVSGIVNQQKADIEAMTAETKKLSSEALNTAKQTNADTLETKRRVDELKAKVESGSAQVQELGSQIKLAQQQIESQSQQVRNLRQDVQAVTSTRNLYDIHRAFPLYGTHVAWAQLPGEPLDPSTKPAGVRYVDLNEATFRNPTESEASTPTLSDKKLDSAMSALNARKYRVILGPIYTYARTNASSQPVGMGLDPNSCGYWPQPSSEPPCIMYFNDSMKSAAMEVRDVLKDVQVVPDNRVLYVDPKQLTAQKRELLSLSAVDIFVVLKDVLH